MVPTLVKNYYNIFFPDALDVPGKIRKKITVHLSVLHPAKDSQGCQQSCNDRDE